MLDLDASLREIRRLDAELAAERAECARLKRQLAGAGDAARRLVALVDNLGAFADDSDPRIMALAGPIGEAQADLWVALGLDCDAEAVRRREDIESRCAVCGWPLVTPRAEGTCRRGDCAQYPRPERLYAPERAAKESVLDEIAKMDGES